MPTSCPPGPASGSAPTPAVDHHDRVSSDGVIGRIRGVVMDCAEPWALARFWAGLLGGTPVEWYPGWVTLEPPPHGQRLSFQTVAGFVAPTWPDPAVPTQMHVDVLVPDLDAAHKRVVGLGARFLAEHVSPRPGPAGEQVMWR